MMGDAAKAMPPLNSTKVLCSWAAFYLNSRSVPPVSATRARRSLLQTIQNIDIVVRGAKNGKP